MKGELKFQGGTSERAKLAEQVIRQTFSQFDVSLAPLVVVTFVESGDTNNFNAFVPNGSSTEIIFNLHSSGFTEVRDFAEMVRVKFIHEYQHLQQHAASNYYALSQAKLDRLMGFVKTHSAQSGYSEVEQFYGFVRFHMLHFHETILAEGTAKYAEYHLDPSSPLISAAVLKEKFIHDYSQWKDYVQKNKEIVQEALRNLKEAIDPTELRRLYTVLKDFFTVAPYAIGYHMVRCVLFYHETITLKQLFELTPDAFILLYEKTMLSNGYRPLFTLGSAGVLSYNEILRNLIDSHKSFRERHPSTN